MSSWQVEPRSAASHCTGAAQLDGQARVCLQSGLICAGSSGWGLLQSGIIGCMTSPNLSRLDAALFALHSELRQVHSCAADDCQPDAGPSIPGCSSDKGSEHSAPCSPPCSPGHNSVFGGLQPPWDPTPCSSSSSTLWAVLRPRHIPTDSHGRTLLHYAVVGKVSCWQPLACWCIASVSGHVCILWAARRLVGCSACGCSTTSCRRSRGHGRSPETARGMCYLTLW